MECQLFSSEFRQTVTVKVDRNNPVFRTYQHPAAICEVTELVAVIRGAITMVRVYHNADLPPMYCAVWCPVNESWLEISGADRPGFRTEIVNNYRDYTGKTPTTEGA
jgi:hypothetical protein